MANSGVVAYNIASFICALFVLEFGADKFIDHTSIVADRTGIPQSVIGLLTAGAEWEEVGSSMSTLK
jgi:Ca2+/Na+ antiporter